MEIEELAKKGLSEREIRKKLKISKTKFREILKQKKIKLEENKKEKSKIEIRIKNREIYIVLAFFLSLLFLWPFLSAKNPPYSDILGHMMRTSQIKNIILNFEIPFWNNFVSSPTLLYRYPLYHLTLAFIMLILPESLSINLFFFISEFLTVIGVFYLLNEISFSNNRIINLIISITSINHFFNLGWMGAWGGFYPMAFGISFIPFLCWLLIKSKNKKDALKYSPVFCLAVLAHPIVAFISILLLIAIAISNKKIKESFVFISFGLGLSCFWILPSLFDINELYSNYLDSNSSITNLQESLKISIFPLSKLNDSGNSYMFFEWFNIFTFFITIIASVYLIINKKLILEILLFFACIPIITNLFGINRILLLIPGFSLLVQAWRPICLMIIISPVLLSKAVEIADKKLIGNKKIIFFSVFTVLFVFSFFLNMGFIPLIKYFYWDTPVPWTHSFDIIKNDSEEYFRITSDLNSPGWVSATETGRTILSDTQTFFTQRIKECSKLVFDNNFLIKENWRNLLDLFAVKYIFVDYGFHKGYVNYLNITRLESLDNIFRFDTKKSFNEMFVSQHRIYGVNSSLYTNEREIKRAFFVPEIIKVSGDEKCICNNFMEFIVEHGVNIYPWPVYDDNGINCFEIENQNFFENLDKTDIIIKEKSQKIEIEINSTQEGYIILKEFYHPGWLVYVNNKRTEIIRALPDYLSVRIMPGNNKIRFEFNPLLMPVRLICIIISIIFVGIYIFGVVKK